MFTQQGLIHNIIKCGGGCNIGVIITIKKRTKVIVCDVCKNGNVHIVCATCGRLGISSLSKQNVRRCYF